MKNWNQEAVRLHRKFLSSAENIAKEDKELKTQLQELIKQYEQDKTVKLQNNFMRGISINKYENFKAIMS